MISFEEPLQSGHPLAQVCDVLTNIRNVTPHGMLTGNEGAGERNRRHDDPDELRTHESFLLRFALVG